MMTDTTFYADIPAALRQFVLDTISNQATALNLPENAPLKAITVEPTKSAAHGDLATNAAMVLAKPCKSNPRKIAELLQPLMAEHPAIEKVEIAGPGFINLVLKTNIWQQLVQQVLAFGDQYGLPVELGQQQPINVEYVSANPTGPMHVGHARSAVFGDALAKLLQVAGYAVTKEYYVNDAGGQIDTLARSVYHRYQEVLGRDVGALPEGAYPGAYVTDAAHSIADKEGDKWLNDDDWLPHFRTQSVQLMLNIIKEDLALLGIEHDVFTSEQHLRDTGVVTNAIQQLQDNELLYRGTLPPPKGKELTDWQAEEQLLFRSTGFGDDADRPVKKANGDLTYFAADIGYHADKINRGFNDMIVMLGADHGGYTSRLQAIVKALSDNKASLDAKLCAMVQLLKNGEPFKMSKRAGTFITVREVIELVGSDALRFTMLTRKNDAPLEFDIEKVTQQTRDNPVFYVQYAHARICSVFKQAGMQLNADFTHVDTSRLNAPAELTTIKTLADWPRQCLAAAKVHEPHRLAYYAIQLAESFHSLWQAGNQDATLRFITDDKKATAARLALLAAVRQTLQQCLQILGVSAPQEM